jgi:hypothetical protein
MATYTEQIKATQAAHMASRAISDATLISLRDIWDEYASGKLTDAKYLAAAKRIVRSAYRDSARVARNLTKSQAEIPEWTPMNSLVSSEYLTSLIDDVERNHKEYLDSDRSDKSARRMRLKFELSAITAAERGFTDSQLMHYGELRDFGFRVRKLWLANFINNEPCADCINLNGTVVDFDSEFPIPTLMKTSVYRDLQGPPLHVRCKCVMVVIITRAENLTERIPTKTNVSPTTMSTKTVKSLPKRIFDSIVNVLRTVSRRIRRDES